MRPYASPLADDWSLHCNGPPCPGTDAPEMLFLAALIRSTLTSYRGVQAVAMPMRFEVLATIVPDARHTIFYYALDDKGRIISALRLGDQRHETAALVALACLARRARTGIKYRVTTPMAVLSTHERLRIAACMDQARLPAGIACSAAPGDSALSIDAAAAARAPLPALAHIIERSFS